jgi:hypothetical protein
MRLMGSLLGYPDDVLPIPTRSPDGEGTVFPPLTAAQLERIESLALAHLQSPSELGTVDTQLGSEHDDQENIDPAG